MSTQLGLSLYQRGYVFPGRLFTSRKLLIMFTRKNRPTGDLSSDKEDSTKFWSFLVRNIRKLKENFKLQQYCAALLIVYRCTSHMHPLPLWPATVSYLASVVTV